MSNTVNGRERKHEMGMSRFKDHILQELRNLPKVKMTSHNAMVICPFHDDNNPSAGVVLDETGRRAPLGWFRCMGCETSVSWNDYAQRAGLRQWDNQRETSDDYLNPSQVKNELMSEEDEGSFDPNLSDLKFKDVELIGDEWRSVPTPVLKKLGCKLCTVRATRRKYVWMPVRALGKLRGYVKAEIEKPADKGSPSYINAKGTWSSKWGLLFFDKAVAMMRKKGLSTIVLCEGPRDAIRLLRFGIPAVSVLGALNWSDEKRFVLEQVDGLNSVFLVMDGDDAGIRATKGIYKNLQGHFTVKYMKLWKYRVPKLDKKGNQMTKELGNGKTKLLWDNELDPFTAPVELLKKIKNALT